MHAALLGSRCVVEAREAYVGVGVLVVEGVHMTDAPETEPPTTPPPRPWIVGPSRRMGMRQLATLAQHYHETMAVVVSHSSAGAHEDHVGMVEEEARCARDGATRSLPVSISVKRPVAEGPQYVESGV